MQNTTFRTSAVNGLFGDLASAPIVESVITFEECIFTDYTSIVHIIILLITLIHVVLH